MEQKRMTYRVSPTTLNNVLHEKSPLVFQLIQRRRYALSINKSLKRIQVLWDPPSWGIPLIVCGVEQGFSIWAIKLPWKPRDKFIKPQEKQGVTKTAKRATKSFLWSEFVVRTTNTEHSRRSNFGSVSTFACMNCTAG